MQSTGTATATAQLPATAQGASTSSGLAHLVIGEVPTYADYFTQASQTQSFADSVSIQSTSEGVPSGQTSAASKSFTDSTDGKVLIDVG